MYIIPLMRLFPALLLVSTLIPISCDRRPADPPASPEADQTGYIHQAFRITEQDLPLLLDGFPESALADPEAFMDLTSAMLSLEGWILYLIDKDHPLPEGFTPPDLVNLAGYPEIRTGKDGLALSRIAAESLAGLSAAASAEGIELTVSSAYRSREYQEGLYARYVKRDGEAAASRYSARPGESQHQLGTAVDFGDITNRFASSDAGGWILENGGDYGWSLSYPQGAEEETGYMWESWHWRYVGRHAAEMQERFFGGSQQAMLEFWAANHQILREKRETD